MTNMRASYDDRVDVLYLVLGHPQEIEGEGLELGVELDFAEADGLPCGVTVIGFRRNGWEDRIGDLAAIAGRHLAHDPAEVAGLLEKIVFH